MKNAWARLQNKQMTAGFTLVEIMVVVTIIAILATIVIVAYQGFGERTRDSQRTTDVAQIKIALDKYYANNGRFPDACGAEGICAVTALSTALNPYLKQVPSDPLSSQGTVTNYRYIVAVDGSGYGIAINYEDATPCLAGVGSAVFAAGPNGPLPKC